MAVMLPEGEDLNEWVAVNSKSANVFFNKGGVQCGLTLVGGQLCTPFWWVRSSVLHAPLCCGWER